MPQSNWLFLNGQRQISAAWLAAEPNLYLHLFSAPTALAVNKAPGDFTDSAWTGSTPQALAGGALTAGNPDDKAETTWTQQEYLNGSGETQNVKGYWVKDHTSNESIFGVLFNGTTGVDVPAGTTLRISPKFRLKSSCADEGGGGGGGGSGTLMHWWQFLENTGTTIGDAIGTNDAEFNGSPTGWSSDSPTTGKSIEIDGNGGLEIASFVPTAGAFSFFCRAKLKASNTPNRLLSSHDGTKQFAHFFESAQHKLNAAFGTSGSNELQTLGITPYGAWHSFGCTFDGWGVGKFYYDGALVGVDIGVTQTNSAGVWYFGRNAGSVNTQAWITDYRVWMGAISADAMAAAHADVGPWA